MIFCAVFLIGFSTLAFEVLLTRIFSIGHAMPGGPIF
jgi:hypothetical protein